MARGGAIPIIPESGKFWPSDILGAAVTGCAERVFAIVGTLAASIGELPPIRLAQFLCRCGITSVGCGLGSRTASDAVAWGLDNFHHRKGIGLVDTRKPVDLFPHNFAEMRNVPGADRQQIIE